MFRRVITLAITSALVALTFAFATPPANAAGGFYFSSFWVKAEVTVGPTFAGKYFSAFPRFESKNRKPYNCEGGAKTNTEWFGALLDGNSYRGPMRRGTYWDTGYDNEFPIQQIPAGGQTIDLEFLARVNGSCWTEDSAFTWDVYLTDPADDGGFNGNAVYRTPYHYSLRLDKDKDAEVNAVEQSGIWEYGTLRAWCTRTELDPYYEDFRGERQDMANRKRWPQEEPVDGSGKPWTVKCERTSISPKSNVARFSIDKYEPLQTGQSTPKAVKVGARYADVSWEPFTGNSGSPIIGYRVRSVPGDVQCETYLASTEGSPTTCQVGPLPEGADYTFRVQSLHRITSEMTEKTRIVAGLASKPSNEITVFEKPNPPINVQASPGDGSLTITWQPPSVNGGSPILGYEAMAIPGGQICRTTGELTCSVPYLRFGQTPDWLENGVPHTVEVRAINEFGYSDFSEPSAPVTPMEPSAPSKAYGLQTEILQPESDGRVRVSWMPPLDDGGARRFEKMRVRAYPESAGAGLGLCGGTLPELRQADGRFACVVTNVKTGTPYQFVVDTYNSPTRFSTSDPSAPITLDGKAPALTVTPLDGAAKVSFANMPDVGGSKVVNYRVVSKPYGRECLAAPSTTSMPSCTITGLMNDSRISYVFTVTAQTENFQDLAFPPSDPVFLIGTPSNPTGVRAEPKKDGSILVTWNREIMDGGSPGHYIATATPGGSTCRPAAADERSCLFTDIESNTDYTFTVRRVTTSGSSRESAPSKPVRVGGLFTAQPPALEPVKVSFRSDPDNVTTGTTVDMYVDVAGELESATVEIRDASGASVGIPSRTISHGNTVVHFTWTPRIAADASATTYTLHAVVKQKEGPAESTTMSNRQTLKVYPLTPDVTTTVEDDLPEGVVDDSSDDDPKQIALDDPNPPGPLDAEDVEGVAAMAEPDPTPPTPAADSTDATRSRRSHQR